MEALWYGLLFGLVVGVVGTAAYVLTEYEVTSKEAARESEITRSAMFSRLHELVAENAKLRVALATGVMSEDARKVANTIMATLDAVIDTEKVAMQECNAFTRTQNIEQRIQVAIDETRSREKLLQ